MKKYKEQWEVYLYDHGHSYDAEAIFYSREEAVRYARQLKLSSDEFELYGIAPDYRVRKVN